MSRTQYLDLQRIDPPTFIHLESQYHGACDPSAEEHRWEHGQPHRPKRCQCVDIAGTQAHWTLSCVRRKRGNEMDTVPTSARLRRKTERRPCDHAGNDNRQKYESSSPASEHSNYPRDPIWFFGSLLQN